MTTDPTGLVVRPARTDDIRTIAELWCQAFPSARTVRDRSRMMETGGPYGGLETVLAGEADGRVVAACKIYRLTQYFTGRPLPMMGLAAVAVDPDQRRRGVGADLCTAALRAARARGDLLSVLYPFRPDYYERLGWGLVGGLHDHRFTTGSLHRYREADKVRVASLATEAQHVMACYHRVAAGSHGPIQRDATAWRYRFAGEDLAVRPLDENALERLDRDHRRLVLVYEDTTIAGYALLRLSRDGEHDGSSLIVRELVAESEAGLRGVLGFLATRSDRWPVARYLARPEERFEDRLVNPTRVGSRPGPGLLFTTARIKRGPMLRLVDVPGALRARRWFDGPSVAASGARQEHAAAMLRIEVRDHEIPENCGPWAVRIGGGDGAARVEPATDHHADASIVGDPAVMARLFGGDISISDAARLGLCQATGKLELADRAFATRETFWLPDQF